MVSSCSYQKTHPVHLFVFVLYKRTSLRPLTKGLSFTFVHFYGQNPPYPSVPWTFSFISRSFDNMAHHMCTPPLVMWRDLSPYGAALHPPGHSSPRVLVIGGGVTGLITSWVLLDHGYHVTIISQSWASYHPNQQRLTSQIAGALWEFPPAVCGKHTDLDSLTHSKIWCMVAYHIWDAIASDPQLSDAAGVRMRPSDFYFLRPIEEDAAQLSKMQEIMASGVRGFHRGADLIKKRNVDSSFGVVDAYEHLAPVIDTDRCMAWLMKLVQAKGAVMITETVSGDLLHIEDELRVRYDADAIVNATGIAGTELADDNTCYPLRGALLRVVNDGRHFPKVDAALTISADVTHDSSEFIFLLPRNDNILLVGGIAQPGQWDLDLTVDSPEVKRMRKRCEEFYPPLKNAKLDEEYPFAQGLRPARGRNVRVERELRYRGPAEKSSMVVHSYGHGGSGWSFSFGCAADVMALIKEAILEERSKTMDMIGNFTIKARL